MFKFFHSPSVSVSGAALLISLATLFSRAIGIIRDRILAGLFGAGPILDTYYAAFKLPDLMYNLVIMGALSAGFIPVFTRLFNEPGQKEKAWKVANNVITIAVILLIGLALIGMVGMSYIVRMVAPGFTAAQQDLLARLSGIMLLSPIILGVSVIFGGILQSMRRFFFFALAPIFYNIGIIIGAIGLVPVQGPEGLAWGVVLGAILHFIIQLLAVRKAGFRYRTELDIRDPDTRLVGKLMLPRTLSLAVSQFSILFITVLASLLPAGSIAAYTFAFNLQAVPIGLIGIPFALAAFPLLSAAAAKQDHADFISKIAGTLRLVLFLTIPAAILMLLLRAQIVRVVLGAGAFDWTDTIMTADTLAFFSLSLFAQSLIPLLARGFFALSDSKTPLAIGLISEGAGLGAAVILMGQLGVAGLALSASLAAIVNCALLAIALRQRLGEFEEDRLIPLVLKISSAGLAMGTTIQLAKYPLAELVDMNTFWGILIQGAASGILGILVYILVSWLLKTQEMLDLSRNLRKRWLKLKHLPIGLDEAEPIKN